MSPRTLPLHIIRERLRHPPQTPPDEELQRDNAAPPRPAAVLLPLFQQGDEWRLLYILRSEHPDDQHSGQVAFPGGGIDPGDPDPVHAALREAEEEVALPPDRVEVLGRLRQYRTVSNYLVTPVVAHIPWPLDLRPEPGEVADIFSIPLPWLADPGNRQVRVWPRPDHREARRVVFYREYEGRQLWGVSARITLSLIRLLQGAPA